MWPEWQMLRREDGHPAALAHGKYALPWTYAVKIVTRRQWTLALRDKPLFIARIIQVTHHLAQTFGRA